MKHFSYDSRTSPGRNYELFNLFVLGEDHEEPMGMNDEITVKDEAGSKPASILDPGPRITNVGSFLSDLWGQIPTPIEQMGAEMKAKADTNFRMQYKEKEIAKRAARKIIFDRFMMDFSDAVKYAEDSGVVFKVIHSDFGDCGNGIHIEASLNNEETSRDFHIVVNEFGSVRLGENQTFQSNATSRDIIYLIYVNLFQ